MEKLEENYSKLDFIQFSKAVFGRLPTFVSINSPYLNIIIDGINLGLTFRNQFKDVYRNSALDLDRAIKNWQPLSSDEIFSDS